MTTHAKIEFDENGVPISTEFDDIYYSKQNGIEETDYVFIRHNALRGRWLRMPDIPDQTFHIVETGFGTGLNFLVAWHNLRYVNRLRQFPISLTFTSFEKFPVQLQDLKTALKAWPKLWFECRTLLQCYPETFSNDYSKTLGDGLNTIHLNLLFGDVNTVIASLEWQDSELADAWFLDGFAPSKNPDMWQPSLFNNMARLSHENTTVATFTAVGLVRRGLIEAGFDVKKYKGFGHKRDMVASRSIENFLNSDALFNSEHCAKLIPRPSLPSKSQSIGIVGGGIAGLLLAYQLLTKSKTATVTLYCADKHVGLRGSSNRQGAVYPLLQAEMSPIAKFYAEAYRAAIPFYRTLFSTIEGVNHGWSGLLQQAIADDMPDKFRHIAKIWSDLAVFKTAKQSSQLAGLNTPYPSLYFPDALWLNPKQMCDALIVHFETAPELKHRFNLKHSTPILAIDDPQLSKHGATILCAGIDTLGIDFERSSNISIRMPLEGVKGQVSELASDQPLEKLKTILCHKGYITPHDGEKQCFGATFEKLGSYQMDEAQSLTEHIADSKNIEQIKKVFPDELWADKLTLNEVKSSNAAIRATTPDHLPVAGVLADSGWLNHYLDNNSGKFQRVEKIKRYVANKFKNIYCLTGLGARGLTSAPMLTDMLSDQILFGATEYSMDSQMNCAPVRFQLRELKKNKQL